MPGKHIFTFFILFILYPFTMAAQYSIVTDRPGQNDSPVSVPKGIFQVETGSLISIDPDQRNWILSGTLFKYGVVENLEIRILPSLVHVRSRPLGEVNTLGIGDLQFGVKYHFLSSGKTDIGYLGHLIVPSGTREVSGGSFGMNHHIAVTHQFADWFSATANTGFEYFAEDTWNGLFALSFGFAITDRIGFFTEVYGSWPGFESADLYYDHGLTWVLSPNLQLDFSTGTGITDKSNYYAVGVSWYAPFRN